MVSWQGSWIWTSDDVPGRNAFVRFRRRFDYKGGKADLHITADSRYVLYVNGEYVGQGPVRAWPNHWRYDTYDIAPLLKTGENVVAVLLNHFGESNFQYNHGPAGLLAQLELKGETISSDGDWKASPDPAFVSAVPRISLQEAFEEQFDAREYDWWTAPDYDDSGWEPAVSIRPADDGFHNNMEDRGIPFLTLEPIMPQRILEREVVRSMPHRFCLYVKPYLLPDDLSSNITYYHGYLATLIWSPSDVEVVWTQPHKNSIPFKVNGKPVEGERVVLRSGWNSVLGALRGSFHSQEVTVCIDGPSELRFCAAGERGGSPWALVGPFGFNDHDRQRMWNMADESAVIAAPLHPEAALEAGEALWETGDLSSIEDKPWFQEMRPQDAPVADVFLQAYTERVVDGGVRLENEDGLLSAGDWAVVHPAEGGDARILIDFGEEIVGFHRFEVEASEGTILDFHNFEFIQPDGRHNLADGMNNSFRYICREGRQEYQTYVRRGFRYTYLILRNVSTPVKLRRMEAVFNSYPQSRRGNFACSDAQLDRIWQVGANTLRCCAEDTYTDCPTYEQTNWVGDARNEALADWAINGDPRLWYRCLEQTGDSLERSSITESNVPSGWQNLLPAWSMLWMRSCREYVLFTGDMEKGRKLLGYVERNVQGIRQHLNSDGLFDIRGWNMFDWAAMDTPSRGVVTHQNCLAVHALRDTAEMADWLGESALADDWRTLAQSLADAVNAHLWNDEKQAYTDCLHDGEHSRVFSQQTQTAAVMSGTATGDRAERCRAIMHNPPEGFVRAGSPFFEFFLLEAYQEEGKEQEFLDTIRRDWGFMVDAGSTTFWEMWSSASLGFSSGERLTRSHCHGWSAAPTFFLSTYILGVRPGAPGFAPTIIEPHPGDLAWCRGWVPTPMGVVEVQWDNAPDQSFVMRVKAPESIELDIRLPRPGKVTINGREQ